MDLTLTPRQQRLKDRATAFSKTVVQPLWNRFETDGRLAVNLAHSAGLLDELQGETDGFGDPITAAILIEELALGEASLALIITHQYLWLRAAEMLRPRPVQKAALDQLNTQGALSRLALLWPPGDQCRPETAATIRAGYLCATSGSSLLCPDASSFIGSATLESAGCERKSVLYLARCHQDQFQFQPRCSLGLQSSPIGKLMVQKQLDRTDLVIEFEDEDHHTDFWRDLTAERKLLSAAVLLGAARAAFEYALEYSKERTAFGKPISQHQAVGLKLADMAIATEAARLMIWRAAEPEAGHLAPDMVDAAWLYTKEVSIEVSIEALQILGGHGYLKLHPVEKWLRDVQTLRILF
jgi:alkylation response protein AidB-like acyl-CoA dehydrogenase